MAKRSNGAGAASAEDRRPPKRSNSEGSLYWDRARRKWTVVVPLPDGERKYFRFDENQKEQANKKLREALHARDRGLPLPNERVTLGQFLTDWLENSARPHLKPSSYCRYEQLIRLHIVPALGKTRLTKLTPREVQKFLNAKAASGLSARTVQYLHATLRTALNRARKWDMVTRNVATLVDPPRGPQRDADPLTAEQAVALLEAASGHRLEYLFALLLSTGLRLGEALALRWQDVDMLGGAINVRHNLERLRGQPWRLVEPKSASGKRTVPLIGPAVTALHAQRTRVLETRLRMGAAWTELDFVFPSELGTPLDGTNVYHEFKKLLRRAARHRYAQEGAVYGDGEEGFARWLGERPDQQRLLEHRVHDTRHSTATYLLAAGVDPRIVLAIMGWSQASMLKRYQHVLPSMLSDAAARLEAVFPAARTGS